MKANRYQKAGVDINAGYQLIHQIKDDVKSTQRKGTTGEIGAFGGMFDLGALAEYHDPILVSGTDGVGTKLMIAQKLQRHETIGIDCVAMCANDILAQGAEPLYFLDYIATGKNDPEKLAQVVSGVAAGCRQAKMAVIGGETAEMPGMYDANEYDIAGFGTGIVNRDELLTATKTQAGDRLIGISSSGIHSNGFSLVRQIVSDTNLDLNEKYDGLAHSLGEELLEPTKIYVDAVLPLIKKKLVNGIAHITGGGLIENVPRMLNDQLMAVVDFSKWPHLSIFDLLQKKGQLDWSDCFTTFNMGIGLVLAVDPEHKNQVLAKLADHGEVGYEIGQIQKRNSNDEPIKIIVDGEDLK